jgi:hypothetical protein
MKYRLPFLIILLLLVVLGIQATVAQDASIEITGVVEAVGDGTVTVNGLPIDLSSVDASTASQLVANSSVRIIGNLQNGVVIAITIEILNQPTPTPTPPPAGPPAVDIEKFVSVDGSATWQDADDTPGPQVALNTPVSFRFVVTNTGQRPLSNLLLTDNTLNLKACTIPATLAPGALFECTVGPYNATAGQHSNLATVVAVAQGNEDDDDNTNNSAEVRDSDPANYFGGERPSIQIIKSVSKDRSNWTDANDDDGPEINVGDDVFFRFVVTNDGTVPVSNITLSDSSYSTADCTIPATLNAGASFECIIGPFDAVAGRHINTVTVRARYNEFDILDSDTASYFGGRRDAGLPVTIIIEGPVQNININIITIYDIDIEINPDDPLLTVIQLGDNVRIEGNQTSQGDTIIIVAVTIVIIDVDIVIGDDNTVVWRDDDGCGNPPPPWAPAHGWRRRCENRGGNVIIIGDDDDDNGNGRGRGRGNDDDD